MNMSDTEAGVIVPEDVVEGVNVNSFRVLDDPTGDGYLLDFCLYDPETECAKVVSRLRASGGLVSAIGERLGKTGAADVQKLTVRFSDLAG